MTAGGVDPFSIRPAVLLAIMAAVLILLYLLVAQDGQDVDLAGAETSAAGTQNRMTADEPIVDSELDAAAAVPSGDDSTDDARERTLAELGNASESFRNTSLLVAIHEAGFVCEVVAEVIPVGLPTEGWRVECPRNFVYSVGVGADGEFEVSPTLSSFDSIVPFQMPPVPPRPRE